jgi:hypothetical protein
MTAQRIGRYLSIAAIVVFVAAIVMGHFIAIPNWVSVGLGVVVGWLLAERNALETRTKQWPIFRRYIDWNRVQTDLHGAADG